MKKKFYAVLFTITAFLTSSPFIAFASNGSSSGKGSTGENANGSCGWGSIIMMVVLLVLMWFFMIRPQRKKEKESKDMQESVEVGDEIVTIGGIVGLVIKTGTDNVVIETGGDRQKIRIKKWAIQENITVNEKIAAENAKKSQNKKSLIAKGGVAAEDEKGKKKKSKAETAKPEKSENLEK